MTHGLANHHSDLGPKPVGVQADTPEGLATGQLLHGVSMPRRGVERLARQPVGISCSFEVRGELLPDVQSLGHVRNALRKNVTRTQQYGDRDAPVSHGVVGICHSWVEARSCDRRERPLAWHRSALTSI